MGAFVEAGELRREGLLFLHYLESRQIPAGLESRGHSPVLMEPYLGRALWGEGQFYKSSEHPL